MLKLFGVAGATPTSPMIEVPVFTAFLTPKHVGEMIQLLNESLTALTTLTADAGNPQ